MKALLAILLAGAASPALAQQSAPASTTAPAASCTPEHAAMGHCTMPAAPKPEPACTAEHAAMGHCKMPDPPEQAAPAATSAPSAAPPPPAQQSSCTPEHAAMGHCTMPAQPKPEPEPAQQSSCTPEHAAMGHCTMPPATAPEPPVAPPPAAALSGPDHAADAVYGPAQMAQSREEMRREHGGLPAYKIFFDRIETRVRDGRDGYLVEGQAWYGGDIDKFWLKTELEGEWRGAVEHAEIQALWSHAIDPWFDVQAGVRYDPQPGPDRAHLVLGVQGLAPYWWEVDGALFLSNKGDVTARAEAEHDVRVTQKLILQPRIEADFALQDIPELHIGSGLSSAAIGARLRYQISPLVGPYVGVEYERAFGDTRRFLRHEGEDPGSFNFVAGMQIWF